MLTLITQSKGGVGKSTLASNLAVECFDRGFRTAVMDADRQGHTAKWILSIEPGIEAVQVSDMVEAEEVLDGFLEEFEVIIADTPGHDENPDLVQMLTLHAELALVPLQPSPADAAELPEAFKYIKLSQKKLGTPDAYLVFNCTATNDRDAREFRELALGRGITVAETHIHRLKAIRKATFRQAVTRLASDEGRKAGDFYRSLFEELLVPRLRKSEETEEREACEEQRLGEEIRRVNE
jgi:cellulose biosynthesis protein BcsQ